jgi:hypothetical protein
MLMESRTKGWFIIAAVVLLPIGLVPVQELPAVRLALDGALDRGPDRPAVLTVSMPASYGLTPLEAKAGLPALNTKLSEQKVRLDGPTFSLRLPGKVSYCTTRLWWAERAGPPVRFILRFSDAPDETYLVYGQSEDAYLVMADGVTVPHERASWRLRVGGLQMAEKHHPPLWVLGLHLERQEL